MDKWREATTCLQGRYAAPRPCSSSHYLSPLSSSKPQSRSGNKQNMTTTSSSSLSCFLFLLSMASLFLSSSSAVRFQSQLSTAVDGIGVGRNGRGRKVGGWTVVPDVESNEEVQELGRFCVEEYNRQHIPTATLRGAGGSGGRLLSFSGVLAAERQVVSGIKYYLKVETFVGRDDDGGDGDSGRRGKIFDAVVVVKPWVEDKERELLSFKPAVVY